MMLLLLFSFPAHAAKKEDNTVNLKKVEEYLNKITTVRANFIQTSPSGKSSEGKFYMSRPGKLRWEYSPPMKILIVSDGSFLIYYNKELDEVSYIPVGDTLLTFLTRDKISLSGDIEVVEAKREGGISRVAVAQSDKREQGTLTMTFDNSPFQLKKLEMEDGNGQITTVSFDNAEYDVALNDKLFTFNMKRAKLRKNK